MHTRSFIAAFVFVAVSGLATSAAGAADAEHADSKSDNASQENESPRHLKDEKQLTQGSVTVGNRKLAYQAETGILVIHLKDPLDSDPPAPDESKNPPPPEAGMSYIAYLQGAQENPRRPITFIFNGGPGSATVWLHMGAFGPKRVITQTDSHTPAAPYRIVDNEYSLLDASDLVFIDAPGTGFGHLRGKDKEKAFYGVDPDAHAFANFIVEFLSRHGRWNSPKYLFGESYGTTRSAVLVNVLQTEKRLDFNGVILLSQILCFDNSPDEPQYNPGVDQPYALVLPTYAATAWYHHKLANPPASLEALLPQVEGFALGEYQQALAAGSTLPAERKAEIAAKLHDYIGLPTEYILQADLRINGGEFEKQLLGSDVTAGRLDARFSGPTIDPMSKEAEYDPQAASISSAYVSAFNDYVRGTLKFGDKKIYKPGIPIWRTWDYLHQPPGAQEKVQAATNVLPDLAVAMKQNPNLKVQVHGGYYDIATPYFAALYELRQLPIQPALRGNIETHFYPSGHMVYAREADLKALHDNVASFIERTHTPLGGETR
jgi:carboxypeptidase C (cathepsin A)